MANEAPAIIPAQPVAPEPSLLELAEQQEARETTPKSRGTKREQEPVAEPVDENDEDGAEQETLDVSDDDAEASDDDGTPGEEQADDEDAEDIQWEDGNTYRVPRTIKEGLMRHADYTRKTQEVAETRRHVEAAKQTVAQQAQIIDKAGLAFAHRQDAVNKLAEIDQKIDFRALEATDPVKAQSWWRYREQLKEFVQNTDAQITAAYSELQLTQQQETARRVEYMNRVLQAKMPGWGQKRADQITEAAMKHYGFTLDEVASIREPRVVMALDDARKWREHSASLKKKTPKQAQKSTAQPSIVPTEKLAKGGSAGGRKRPEDMNPGEWAEYMNRIERQQRDAKGRFR